MNRDCRLGAAMVGKGDHCCYSRGSGACNTAFVHLIAARFPGELDAVKGERSDGCGFGWSNGTRLSSDASTPSRACGRRGREKDDDEEEEEEEWRADERTEKGGRGSRGGGEGVRREERGGLGIMQLPLTGVAMGATRDGDAAIHRTDLVGDAIAARLLPRWVSGTSGSAKSMPSAAAHAHRMKP